MTTKIIGALAITAVLIGVSFALTDYLRDDFHSQENNAPQQTGATPSDRRKKRALVLTNDWQIVPPDASVPPGSEIWHFLTSDSDSTQTHLPRTGS